MQLKTSLISKVHRFTKHRISKAIVKWLEPILKLLVQVHGLDVVYLKVHLRFSNIKGLGLQFTVELSSKPCL
jgi:hypothetical protein